MTRIRPMAMAVMRAAIVGVISIGCGSCSDQYLARRDTMSPGSGNAVQADIATQVVNPWPRSANQAFANTDGTLLQHAIERYRNPASAAATPAAATSVGAAASGGAPTSR